MEEAFDYKTKQLRQAYDISTIVDATWESSAGMERNFLAAIIEAVRPPDTTLKTIDPKATLQQAHDVLQRVLLKATDEEDTDIVSALSGDPALLDEFVHMFRAYLPDSADTTKSTASLPATNRSQC